VSAMVEDSRPFEQIRAIGGAFVLAALFTYALAVDPQTGQGGIPCLWKTLFGFDCPGCGISRAAALLLRGDLEKAARANWLIVPFACVSVWKSALQARRLIRLIDHRKRTPQWLN